MSRYGDDHNAWVKENLFDTICDFLKEVYLPYYETPIQCLLGIVGDAIAENDERIKREEQKTPCDDCQEFSCDGCPNKDRR